MAVKSAPAGGGGYFDPEQFESAKAVLFEVKKIDKDQPNPPYDNRDVVTADVTAFMTTDDLKGNSVPTTLSRTRITGKALVNDLTEAFEAGDDYVGKLLLKPSQTRGFKPFWVLRPVDAAVVEAVAAYIDARETKVKAALESADAPDWL